MAKLLFFFVICKETSNFVYFLLQMRLLYLSISIILLISCTTKKAEQEVTPWGTVIGESAEETTDTTGTTLNLNDIIDQGEMIMLTVSGPETYYDYHGHGMGVHYLLCTEFSSKLGVKLRVEVCKDSTELIDKLRNGEGDIIACPIKGRDITNCGPGWAVAETNAELAKRIDNWYKPDMLTETEKKQKELLATGGVTRHVYAPMINRQKGLISKWDGLFQKYAPTARLDWKLMAAQCYQESCFDPKAHSWAGACGLMQIMPSTAKYLGLPIEDIYTPEANIKASAKLMNELMNNFRDAASQQDRICFALAAYNGGEGHVRDAMALASKNGKDSHRWSSVQEYILKLSDPQYYNDPVVKRGYMRGSETSGYVDRIMKRWADYGGRPARSHVGFSNYEGPSTQPSTSGTMGPQRATKKHKYNVQ